MRNKLLLLKMVILFLLIVFLLQFSFNAKTDCDACNFAGNDFGDFLNEYFGKCIYPYKQPVFLNQLPLINNSSSKGISEKSSLPDENEKVNSG